MPLDVELFVSPYCKRCHAARQQLEAAIADLPMGALRYQERDVVEHLDRAVELGVRATPSLAISGRLRSAIDWDRAALRTLLDDQLKQEH